MRGCAKVRAGSGPQAPTSPRFRPRHPRLGAAATRLLQPAISAYYRHKGIHRPNGGLASERRRLLRAALDRGERVWLAGIGIGGYHNSGVALVEIDPETGPRLLCNNEEERFCGRKHASCHPRGALDELCRTMRSFDVPPERVMAWLASWDFPLLAAVGIGKLLEEFPASLDNLLRQDADSGVDIAGVCQGLLAPRRLGELLGSRGRVPIIGMPHHENHASFAYMASPFAREAGPVMVLVSDGSGDCASTSLYLGRHGRLDLLRHNGSFCDSIGAFYSVISSTQGGWTMLSSEGRYMGAAAYGDMRRESNPFYRRLQPIFRHDSDGFVRLNRSLANWQCSTFRTPYSRELTGILGPPIPLQDMWNPDAMLRVDEIRHAPQTQERVDKAAATQLVFEDALMHMVECFIRRTGSDRLVLSGGTALNAVANMRLLEHFDETFYRRALGRATRLHLWVPPVPGDAGVTVGAAYSFALRAGVPPGPPLKHAFYCGRGSDCAEWLSALRAAECEWMSIANPGVAGGRREVADLMAFLTARDAVIAVVQGAAETGPRALGHRSILASARNPHARELINERVKYRERIRPLAPMATLRAARELFYLNEGAAEDDYNAYNYMVITTRARPEARMKVPAVVHADGTARIQIVRPDTDPVIHAYLEALGRRSGVEVAVNTSFNVAAPIAQTPAQALETLRRARGMDGLFAFADDGPVFLAWRRAARPASGRRMREWVELWQRERYGRPGERSERAMPAR